MRAFDIIEEARDLLNDPDADFWTDAKLLTHLNRALRDVTTRSRSIREVIYKRTNAGQSVYALPEGFLGNDKFAWLYAGQWYPLHKRSLSQVEFLNNSDFITSWRPFFYDVWGRSRVERIVATVEAVSFEDGAVNPDFSDPPFPSNSEMFGFKFTDNLPGTDDVKVGDQVINMTDGSEGIVTGRRNDQPGRGLFAAARLVNGRRAGEDYGRIYVGDRVRILTPNVSGHALRISPAPDSDSAPGEEALWMYLSRRHYVIQQSHIDNVNDVLELDIELETAGLERLIYWCRREELGARDPETLAQKQLYESAYHDVMRDVLQRNRTHESTWGQPSLQAWRQNIELEGVTTTDGHALNNVFVR